MNIHGWPEAVAAGPQVCGGKGHRLGMVARYGFRVPRGGVVPATWYTEQLRRSKPQLFERTASASAADTAQPAVMEPLSEIHESNRALAYRHRMGFDNSNVQCAVVICEMVQAEGAQGPQCAGVAFAAPIATRHGMPEGAELMRRHEGSSCRYPERRSRMPRTRRLFLTAGALVMEMGGANSYGAVVARVYGIPAVVGVPDATQLIVAGQRLTVDGSSGTIGVAS